MAYDPTITAGNVLTMVSVVTVAVTFLIRQSYAAGRYAMEFIQVHRDLAEIKQSLKDQDAAFKKKSEADSLSDGMLLVLQQRIFTVEKELNRTRLNVHQMAQAMQIKVLQHEEPEI